MNHVYRLVFNRSLGLWQVVGEHAHRQGKRGGACTRKRRAAHASLPKTLVALASLSGLPTLALAASITGSGDVVPTLPAGPLTDWNVYDVLHIGQHDAGTLLVKDGGKLFSYTSRIGTERGSEGSVTIAGAGSTWTHAGHLVIGLAGQGTLNVEDGGHVSNDFASIGEQAGSFGRVRITGGSSWQTSALWVGWYGRGELVVDGGSQVSSSLPGFIGAEAGSEGIATVSGPGSIWSLTGSGIDGRLQVGDSGRGRLNILDGGKVTSVSGAIGFNPDAIGHVVVSGQDSSWVVEDLLRVGFSGSGSLDIRDGASVISRIASIGNAPGGKGVVKVTGPDSSWELRDSNSANLLYVGAAGDGTLLIEDGGTVSNYRGFIGNTTSAVGAVTVTGAGSRWDNASHLFIGVKGKGTLDIRDNGHVTNLNGILGSERGGRGEASVSGPGSTWTNQGDLYVGDYGAGTLNIDNGGTVTNVVGLIGRAFGSQGTATVSGRDSRWSNSSSLHVGNGGSGRLTIRDGGQVSSQSGDVAVGRGSRGDVLIDGAGSAWTNTANLSVGTAGNGTLQIQNGGSVTHSSGLVGGVGGTGAVTVIGPDSRWTSASLLSVGHGGQGSLSIRDGAMATSQNGVIGNLWGSNGRVTVAGPGSQWISDQKLEVGLQGKGTLEILDGGKVKSQSNQIGNSATGQGAVRVSGAGSTWEAGQSVSVGQGGGTGTLTVEDGGSVSSEVISIGTNPNSKGEVVVRTGALLEASFGLAVGSQAGQGTLRIEQGGQVSSGTSMIGSIDATGHVTVKDAGSLWKADDVSIGFATGGAEASTLTLSDGGTLQTGRLSLASFMNNDAATLNIGAAAGAAATGAGRLEAPEVYFGQGAATINFNHTDANHDFDARLLSDSARHDGHQIDQRSGTTRLTADNAGYLGITNVHAGKLVVADRIGGEARVRGGTLQFGDGGSGRLSQLDALSVTGADSTLAVQGPAAIKVNGDLSMADQTRLSLDSPGATPAIQAHGMTLGQDVAFNLSGIRNASELDKVLIDTRDGIRGDFGRVTVGGFDGTVDYLTLNTRKSEDGKQYLASYGLSWTAGNDLAHGTFTLTNDGDSFDLGVALADQAANPARGWNGTALTKAGAGTLILSADNTYSGGTTIDAGTLQLGNGGNTGSIVGDVVNHGALAFNRNDRFVFDGAISGTGKVIQKGSGTTVLTADNTYRGGTTLAGGTLQVERDSQLGDASGGLTFEGGTLSTTASFDTRREVTLTANGAFDVATGTALGLAGIVTGAGDLVKRGDGTLRLTHADNDYGNTRIQSGTLVGDAASISGHIGNAGTVIFEQAEDAVFAGNIGTLDGEKGRMIKQGQGVLELTGLSTLDWSLQAGGLTTAAERFGGNAEILSGASLTFDQQDDAQYAGTLSGTGRFIKSGTGRLRLGTDHGAFHGFTEVVDGNLQVDSKLGGSLVVRSGGTLSGAGSVGSGPGTRITIADGGTLSPGNGIGSLTLRGDLAFEQGSRFAIDLSSTQSDRVDVLGTATLQGGDVVVAKVGGVYLPGSHWTILNATGGVRGTFASISEDLPYVGLTLKYDANNVYLDIARNDTPLCLSGFSFNQCATANGVASLPQDHVLQDIMASQVSAETAAHAFDQLSGEIHASLRTSLIEDSRFLRDAAAHRLRSAFDDALIPADGGTAGWLRTLGSWGNADSDGNAARTRRTSTGLLAGADIGPMENTRLGLMTGYHRSNTKAGDRGSSARGDHYHLGFYAGSQWDAFGLRGGLSHSWHRLDVQRQVAIPGFSDHLRSHYSARTTQAFVEAGYRLPVSSLALEPFAALAHVRASGDGFTEQGGNAALRVSGDTTGVTFSTLGMCAQKRFGRADRPLSARGLLGWRHTFDRLAPLSTHTFAGSQPFTIAGTPLARNSAVVEAGLHAVVAERTTFALTYEGQLARDARDHALQATLQIRF